jgi:hypothetical protein
VRTGAVGTEGARRMVEVLIAGLRSGSPAGARPD